MQDHEYMLGRESSTRLHSENGTSQIMYLHMNHDIIKKIFKNMLKLCFEINLISFFYLTDALRGFSQCQLVLLDKWSN